MQAALVWQRGSPQFEDIRTRRAVTESDIMRICDLWNNGDFEDLSIVGLSEVGIVVAHKGDNGLPCVHVITWDSIPQHAKVVN